MLNTIGDIITVRRIMSCFKNFSKLPDVWYLLIHIQTKNTLMWSSMHYNLQKSNFYCLDDIPSP